MKERWICSYAGANLKPCHKPATWIIEHGILKVGACNAHRATIIASLMPKIRMRPYDGDSNDE